MATQGTAAKSASGASMSKYDVEVEGRLQALEAKAHTHERRWRSGDSSQTSCAPAKKSGDGGKVDKLIQVLNKCDITQYYPKGADGKRRIDI